MSTFYTLFLLYPSLITFRRFALFLLTLRISIPNKKVRDMILSSTSFFFFLLMPVRSLALIPEHNPPRGLRVGRSVSHIPEILRLAFPPSPLVPDSLSLTLYLSLSFSFSFTHTYTRKHGYITLKSMFIMDRFLSH